MSPPTRQTAPTCEGVITGATNCKESLMAHIGIASWIGGGVAAVAVLVAVTAPTAQAVTPLAADQVFCKTLGGAFTTEVFGGQTRSTCTFTVAGDTHHLRYENGLFTGSD